MFFCFKMLTMVILNYLDCLDSFILHRIQIHVEKRIHNWITQGFCVKVGNHHMYFYKITYNTYDIIIIRILKSIKYGQTISERTLCYWMDLQKFYFQWQMLHLRCRSLLVMHVFSENVNMYEYDICFASCCIGLIMSLNYNNIQFNKTPRVTGKQKYGDYRSCSDQWKNICQTCIYTCTYASCTESATLSAR